LGDRIPILSPNHMKAFTSAPPVPKAETGFKLRNYELLSNVAFKFNLRRYIKVAGENALCRFDQDAYDKIITNCRGEVEWCRLTL